MFVNQFISDYRKQLEKVLIESPQREAIIYQGRSYTYQQIETESAKVQERLQRLGLKPGDVVALLAPRSIETIFSLFGIIRSGLAFLPIDSASPQERIDYIIEASGASCLLDENQLIKKIAVQHDNPELSAFGQEGLAYLIYTSGSTGKPKGILIGEDALNQFIYSIDQAVSIGPDRVVLSSTTLSFDISILESLIAFLLGSKIVFADDVENKTPSSLAKLIKEYQIDLVQLTPSMLKLVLRSDPYCFSGVKDLLIGGEKLDETLYHKIRSLMGGNIYNVYGPTECTIWASIKLLNDGSEKVSVGKPLSGSKIMIVDGHQTLPEGEIGEVAIAGAQLAIGYTAPEITAQKFLTNFSNEDKRVYLTGDLGYIMQNGDLQIIGRKDSQVKINGNRVELEEIRETISEIPYVRDAAVCYLKPQEEASGTLCALVIPSGDVTADKILESLNHKLPGYMIPSYIEFGEKIPLNLNGKVDVPLISKHFSKSIKSKFSDDSLLPLKKDNFTEKVLSIFYDACGIKLEPNELDKKINNLGVDSFKFANLLMTLEDELSIDFEQSISIYSVESVRELIEICSEKVN